jgi:hypothetical protein
MRRNSLRDEPSQVATVSLELMVSMHAVYLAELQIRKGVFILTLQIHLQGNGVMKNARPWPTVA